MKNKPYFLYLNNSFSGYRLIVIIILLILGAGMLYYFNQLGKALEDREKKYANLYAESLNFFMTKAIDSDCDYTFVQEVLDANQTIPIVVTFNGEVLNYINIKEIDEAKRDLNEEEKKQIVASKVESMKYSNPPLEINYLGGKALVYFSNSIVVNELRYFPYMLLGTFLIFGLLAFIAYSSSRTAEENKVWVGLAKETAHQLGTPISALVAWIEVLRANPDFDQEIGNEMVKDIDRLDTITRRFSNIGSVPSVTKEEVSDLLNQTTNYLKKRVSTKINWQIINEISNPTFISINKPLFEWVIENLTKNAVDAMSGVGNLQIKLQQIDNKSIAIDISDTGRGISTKNLRKIFKPGFTSKKRGWGLGLTLAKRIIETYHNGSLTVKNTVVGKGTTFRIVLKTD